MGFPLSDAEHARIKAMIDSQPEVIVAAAIRHDDIIVMVERPWRHAACINFLWGCGLDHSDQGFITNRGRFVDRREAAEIATAAGQATPRTMCNGNLFSEDVWNDHENEGREPAINPADIF